MDDDLEQLDREQLRAEVKKLRAGIRAHRDCSGHELRWYQPQLWALLPEHKTHLPEVPAWPQFMRGCVAYRASLDVQCPDAPRVTREFTSSKDQD